MIKAEIVGHSLSPQGEELMSVLCTFPRIILAEVNTHRMLSKNTSSSRAIPFLKMVEIIENNPFIPIAWQKEHKGMQGTEYWTEEDKVNGHSKIASLQSSWLHARTAAVDRAKFLHSDGLTKQLTNRLLEPFMWTTMLITGSKSGWDNFFRLRCPQYVTPVGGKDEDGSDWIYNSRKDVMEGHSNEDNFTMMENFTEVDWLKLNKGQAEIHIMDLAEKIWDARNESTPDQLEAGEWHIPFEDRINVLGDNFPYGVTNAKVKISVAMGARTSYTIVGEEKEINNEALIGLHDRLLVQQPPHSSPMEHCARAMDDDEFDSFYRGKCYLDISEEEDESNKGWCYNLKGFIPYRYMIDNSMSL